MNDEPIEAGTEASKGANAPSVPQAATSISRLLIMVVVIIIAALLAVGTYVLSHLPQPKPVQSSIQQP